MAIDLFLFSKWDGAPLWLFQGRLFDVFHLVENGGFRLNYLQAALLGFGAGAVLLFVLCALLWRHWTAAGR